MNHKIRAGRLWFIWFTGVCVFIWLTHTYSYPCISFQEFPLSKETGCYSKMLWRRKLRNKGNIHQIWRCHLSSWSRVETCGWPPSQRLWVLCQFSSWNQSGETADAYSIQFERSNWRSFITVAGCVYAKLIFTVCNASRRCKKAIGG